jgi:uridylate kinase
MKRFVMKISGEAIGDTGFSAEKTAFLVNEIVSAKKKSKAQIALVVGGGNIWRKRDSKEFGFSGADSDMIGMGATMLNASVLKNALCLAGVDACVYSPHSFADISKKHSVSIESDELGSGESGDFAGGTGAPFFTTDSAAVVRALELQADAVLKGTKVSGVYDSDPKKIPMLENSIPFRMPMLLKIILRSWMRLLLR